MKIRGLVKKIVFQGERITKLEVEDVDSSDRFLFSAMDMSFNGEVVGKVFDFDATGIVKAKQSKSGSNFEEQHFYINSMEKVKEA